jgi:hypothetical protein
LGNAQRTTRNEAISVAGIEKVNIEFTLAAISFNLTRLLARRQSGPAT